MNGGELRDYRRVAELGGLEVRDLDGFAHDPMARQVDALALIDRRRELRRERRRKTPRPVSWLLVACLLLTLVAIASLAVGP